MRKANIQEQERDIFERFGEGAIQLTLAVGLRGPTPELWAIYENPAHARDWLTEMGDAREQREQRLETVEWAILIFVVFGVIADFKLAGWLP